MLFIHFYIILRHVISYKKKRKKIKLDIQGILSTRNIQWKEYLVQGIHIIIKHFESMHFYINTILFFGQNLSMQTPFMQNCFRGKLKSMIPNHDINNQCNR